MRTHSSLSMLGYARGLDRERAEPVGVSAIVAAFVNMRGKERGGWGPCFLLSVCSCY